MATSANVDLRNWYQQATSPLLDGSYPTSERPAGGGSLDLTQYTTGTVNNFGHGGNTSGVTYNSTKDTVLTIRNGTRAVNEYNAGDMSSVRSFTLPSIDNKSDFEDIAWMGGTEYCICAEDAGAYVIGVVDIPDGASPTVTVKAFYTLAAAGADNNSGLEGICYDRTNGIFYAVGEGQQASTSRRFFKLLRPANTTTNYSYDTDVEMQSPNLTEPFDPESALSTLGVDGAAWDLSGIEYHEGSGNVIILSHTGDELAEIDPADGTIVSQMSLTNMTQQEGVTILGDGTILVVGEADEWQKLTVV